MCKTYLPKKWRTQSHLNYYLIKYLNFTQQISERHAILKQNSREVQAKIEKTKKTQEALLRDFDEHMKEINKNKVLSYETEERNVKTKLAKN